MSDGENMLYFILLVLQLSRTMERGIHLINTSSGSLLVLVLKGAKETFAHFVYPSTPCVKKEERYLSALMLKSQERCLPHSSFHVLLRTINNDSYKLHLACPLCIFLHHLRP